MSVSVFVQFGQRCARRRLEVAVNVTRPSKLCRVDGLGGMGAFSLIVLSFQDSRV